ncbi:AlbA family DNA-binding domain-containing protein [Algoriella sp.]|uniref:AlbA family DNA-binding domain-containing protein n=1 Tax=Algoriella sp. TaxID=1872434 RepID=UPI002FC6A236
MNQHLIDLILYENENTSLDFKKTEYRKENYEEFLKDIISFANANSKGIKYIIIGVKDQSDGERLFFNVDSITDDAIFQQLVSSNIEPEINFKYYPFQYDEKTFGIFEISETIDKPYMMKKSKGKLLEGHSFIRKGSSTKNLCRADLDHIFNNKSENISKDIAISLFEDRILKEAEIELKISISPSTRRANKLNKLIESKKKTLDEFPIKFSAPSWMKSHGGFNQIDDEDKSITELEDELESVKELYNENDNYFFKEKNAQKLNFYINNSSSVFLEEVSVEIFIKKSDNYLILEKKVPEPYVYDITNVLNRTIPIDYDRINYPDVRLTNNGYKIRVDIDTVKHHLPKKILKVPLRMVLFNHNKLEYEVEFIIFAKNLKTPVKDKIKVKYIYNEEI